MNDVERLAEARRARAAAAESGDTSAFVGARARELALEERVRLGRGGIVWDPLAHPRGRLGRWIMKLATGRALPKGKASYAVKGVPVSPGNPLYVSPSQYSAALRAIIATLRSEGQKREGGLDQWERGRIKGLSAAKRIVERSDNWTLIARAAREYKENGGSGDDDYDDGYQTGMRTAYLLHDELEDNNAQDRLWKKPKNAEAA